MSAIQLQTGGWPIWWHHHDMKMTINEAESDVSQNVLVISGSAAKLTIKKISSEFPDYKFEDGWLVDWEVSHWTPIGLGAHGRCMMTDNELLDAFNLLKDNSEDGGDLEYLMAEISKEHKKQGKYIRYEQYLNIPCPGTGHDGDPNVSIEIDEAMQEAIKKLLEK